MALVKHDQGGQRNDGRIHPSLHRIIGESGIQGGLDHHYGDGHHKGCVKCEPHPKTFLQCLNDRIFTVDTAFFTGRQPLSGETPTFDCVEKTHGGLIAVATEKPARTDSRGGEPTRLSGPWQWANPALLKLIGRTCEDCRIQENGRII